VPYGNAARRRRKRGRLFYVAESFEPAFPSVLGSADPGRLRARIDQIVLKKLARRHAETSAAAHATFANAVQNSFMKLAQFHSEAAVSAGDAISKSTPKADATLTAMTSE
jgi:hypothetical protein